MEDTAPRYTSSSFIPLPTAGVEFVANRCVPTNYSRNHNNSNCGIGLEYSSVDYKTQSSKRPRRSLEGTYRNAAWKSKETYSPGIVGLHEEIEEFYNFVIPTRAEDAMRLLAVEHITKVVNSLWPQAKVEVFGSYRTGLCLPTSDIDMVILGEWDSLPLHTLGKALESSGISGSDINVIAKASVPIIKLVHTPSRVKVDISFNMRNGVKSAKMIKGYKKKYPVLPKLVMVLKQFLLNRNLNEVFNGGMSSYCLTLLIISYLQGPHKPGSPTASTNLGTLLLEFFELYGLNFNYENVAISVSDGGSYKPKTAPWASFLSVEDPLQEGNDIAKGSYLMQTVKLSFQNAYYVLHKHVTSSGSIRPNSILGEIISIEDPVLEHRQWVIDNLHSVTNMLKALKDNDNEERVDEDSDLKGRDSNPLLSDQHSVVPQSHSLSTSNSSSLSQAAVPQHIPRLSPRSDIIVGAIVRNDAKLVPQAFQKVKNSRPTNPSGPSKSDSDMSSACAMSSGSMPPIHSKQVTREFHSQRYIHGNGQAFKFSADRNQPYNAQEKPSVSYKKSKQRNKRDSEKISSSRQR